MNIEEDPLFKKICEQANWFGKEAKNHKSLKRALWSLSTVISVGVALVANNQFSIYEITSSHITAFLSIILPVVTGYTVLRSPESL